MNSNNNPISIELKEDQATSGQDIHGIIKLAYNSRYDTIVINSQIEDSSGAFEFIELNGRRIDYPYPRLSIFEKDLSGQKMIVFTARTNHVPLDASKKVKFRVSIVQEHKEIASDITYLNLHR
ncbi:MAG TPA: hypothetical protein VE130_11120 [Nitrososphaeraceae archaeon]|nr:hypothetical protein [Nitrososphaeraceae archaeon]